MLIPSSKKSGDVYISMTLIIISITTLVNMK